VANYDAIVVGAGPAGSTCAYRLASAGASVLLLDRARFPCDEPCGGAVTARALHQFPVANPKLSFTLAKTPLFWNP